MNETKNTTDSSSRPRFASQWLENDLSDGQFFTLPSCTVPDQSMTIPEIIARFTRTGQLPASFKMNDQGGNIAADPEADPLDDYQEVMARKAAAEAAKKKDPEPDSDSAPAPAGA